MFKKNHICLMPKKTFKVLTPIVTHINKNTFVGRAKEVDIIDKFFTISNALVLTSDIGGVGRSSLASHYLDININKFDYYGYIKINDSFRQSFTSSFKESLSLEQNSLNDLFIEAITKLGNLNGNKFLIIDNSKGIEVSKHKLNLILNLINKNFKILFISNKKIKDIRDYEIGALSVDDALQLFINYCPTSQKKSVEKIVEYCGYHTFFIKLLAKRVYSSGYNLDKIIDMFNSKQLMPLKKGNIMLLININIQKLFFMQKLDRECISLLKKLSALPSIEISSDFISILLKDKLRDKLEALAFFGWISKQGNGYKLHHIVKNHILNYNHATFNDITYIVEYFNHLIKDSYSKEALINAKKNLLYFKSLNSILQRFDIQHDKISTFYQNLASIYHQLGEDNKAIEILNKSLVNNKHSLKGAKNYNNLGLIYKSSKEYKNALYWLNKSLNIRIDILGEFNIETARSYNNVGLIYRLIGNYEKAFIYFNKSLNIKDKLLDKYDIERSYLYHNMALTYQQILDYKKAQFYFQKVIKIREKYLGKNSLETAMGYSNLALLYRDINKHSMALSLLKKSIKIYKNNLGEEHQKSVYNYNYIAQIYKDINSDDLAMHYIKKVLKIDLTHLGEYHPKTALAYNNLGLLYLSKNNYTQSKAFFVKSISILKNILGEEHLDCAIISVNLAISKYFIKDYIDSKRILIKALNTYENILGILHPKTLSLQNLLALLFAKLNRYDKALDIYHQSINHSKSVIKDGDLNTALSYHNISIIFLHIKEYEKALINMQKCVDIRLRLLPRKDKYLLNTIDKMIIIKNLLYKEKKCREVDDFIELDFDIFTSDKHLDNLFMMRE